MTKFNNVGFAVMSERCDQCLYGPNKIVSNERRRQILQDIERKDSHFVCHKASIKGVSAACRGDYDQRGCGQLGRIMERLNAVAFVSEDDLSQLPPAPDDSDEEDQSDDYS